MYSHFLCLLVFHILLVVPTLAEKYPECRADKTGLTKILSAVFPGTFSGCIITPQEAKIGLSRLHWIIPKGSQCKFATSGKTGPIITQLIQAGLGKTNAKIVIKLLNIAGTSLTKKGLLRVDVKCLDRVPVDVTFSVLSKSINANLFNKRLEVICGHKIKISGKQFDNEMKTVERVSKADIIAVVIPLMICMICAFIGFFIPVLLGLPIVLFVLKSIVGLLIVIL